MSMTDELIKQRLIEHLLVEYKQDLEELNLLELRVHMSLSKAVIDTILNLGE